MDPPTVKQIHQARNTHMQTTHNQSRYQSARKRPPVHSGTRHVIPDDRCPAGNRTGQCRGHASRYATTPLPDMADALDAIIANTDGKEQTAARTVIAKAADEPSVGDCELPLGSFRAGACCWATGACWVTRRGRGRWGATGVVGVVTSVVAVRRASAVASAVAAAVAAAAVAGVAAVRRATAVMVRQTGCPLAVAASPALTQRLLPTWPFAASRASSPSENSTRRLHMLDTLKAMQARRLRWQLEVRGGGDAAGGGTPLPPCGWATQAAPRGGRGAAATAATTGGVAVCDGGAPASARLLASDMFRTRSGKAEATPTSPPPPRSASVPDGGAKLHRLRKYYLRPSREPSADVFKSANGGAERRECGAVSDAGGGAHSFASAQHNNVPTPADAHMLLDALDAFDTAENVFDAVVKELDKAKTDLYWAQRAFAWLFRLVTLPEDAGGELPLAAAYAVSPTYTIGLAEMKEVTHAVAATACNTSTPLLVIHVLVALS